jgi:hypothetical protein
MPDRRQSQRHCYHRSRQLLINGWTAEGVPFVATLLNGTVQFLQTMPEGAFLNGITQIAPNLYLMADSYRGAIWSFNLSTHTADIWLEHPLLARSGRDRPIPRGKWAQAF